MLHIMGTLADLGCYSRRVGGLINYLVSWYCVDPCVDLGCYKLCHGGELINVNVDPLLHSDNTVSASQGARVYT